MKKLLLLTLMTAFGFTGFASHLMGGELVVKHDTGQTHTVILRLYRDDYGIPLAQNQTVTYVDSITMTSATVQLSLDTSGFLPTTAYPIEFGYYSAQVQLGLGLYGFAWDNCCRNAAIQNAANPGSASMQLHAILLVDGMGNSSPDFMIQPTLVVPVDTVWTHNSLPFDPNGDSISWYLDTPLDADVNGQQVYVAGYSHPASDTTGPFTIDQVTGTISWDPAVTGNFIASMLIGEYRAGQLIGGVRRDYQFVVINDSSSLRIANLNSIPQDGNGRYAFDLDANNAFNFNLIASNTNGNITLEVYGEPFNFATNPATVNVSNGTGTASADLSWTPSPAQARNRPYPVVYRLLDDVFVFDFTVLYNVSNNVGIEENAEVELSAYPNPSTDFVNLSSKEKLQRVDVYTVNGQLVDSYFVNGDNTVQIEKPASSGIYLLHITTESGVHTRKVSFQ